MELFRVFMLQSEFFRRNPLCTGAECATMEPEIHRSKQEAVAWAIKNNIVQGYEDGTFRPNNMATRAHMAVIIARFCENYKAF